MPRRLARNSELLAAAESFRASIADMHHMILDLWEVDDDTVVGLMDVHYTRHDGRELNLPCCNVFRMRDGIINDYRIYMDVNPVLAP
jgi:ketosteroid isomerase-like protein